MSQSTYNILMYSHDTYGLGHIRRTMAIARSLVDEGVNILILTGSPIAGRFNFPMGIDFVRMPGMIKQTNSVYVPHSIRVNPRHAIDIRMSIITATAQTFDPQVFIVDKVPLGLKGEIVPTLEWFKHARPETKVILGLRDILDDAESTRAEWEEKSFPEVLRRLYSEIWVYGERDVYDPIAEYGIPEDVAAKTVFTGYIPRPVPQKRNGRKSRPLVAVTIGGGADGYPVLDNWLTMLETWPDPPFSTFMVTGPFLGGDMRDGLETRARKLGIRFSTFHKNIEKKLVHADLVVSMGGYNTVCEILSMRKPSLLVPRNRPRQEQQIRAEVFKKRGLVDFIPWDDLNPALLREKTLEMLDNAAPYVRAVSEFPMTGLDVMRARVAEFRREP